MQNGLTVDNNEAICRISAHLCDFSHTGTKRKYEHEYTISVISILQCETGCASLSMVIKNLNIYNIIEVR